MKSFALLVAILALIQTSGAFTTRPAALSSPQTAQAKQPSLTSQQMFVDWGAAEITNAPAIGSIYSLFACVAIWELVTPGRLKKED